MTYAQINEENICVGVSQLSGEVDSPLLIPIANFDHLVIGKRYNNGVWEEIEQPEITPKPTETENEFIQAEILLNQAEIIAKQKEQDEVLAELLLGQQEVQADV